MSFTTSQAASSNFAYSKVSSGSQSHQKASEGKRKLEEFKSKRTMAKGSSKLFEGGASADDDAELDQAIRDVFNSKNEQLLEKNQSLLNVVDDERNEKIKEFVD